jgi:hypothetical protein
MLIDIETLRYKCLQELMETGRLDWYFHHILLYNQEVPILSQMDTLIVQDVELQNVNKNVQRVCQKFKLQEMMSVDILALKMEVGKKVNIQEFIETLKSLKQ